MKLLHVIFYNYTRWFEKVSFTSAHVITNAFFLMAILLIIAICALGDTFIFHSNQPTDNNFRTDAIAITATIVPVLLYFCLIFNGKAKVIVGKQPKFFGSDGISVLITLLFTLVCLGTILLVPMK